MKLFTSSILFTSVFLASFLAAEQEDVRQASQPMKKTIKRRTDAPEVEVPKPAEKKGPSSWGQWGAQDEAGEEDDFFKRLTTQMKFDNEWAERRGVKATPPPKPNGQQQKPQNAEGDDFLKRISTEMEEFERNWAQRRGVDTPQKPKAGAQGAGAAGAAAGTNGQAAQKPKFNMDDLLGPSSGLKDIVAPLADAVGKDPKLQQNLRQASQEFIKDPASILNKDGPIRKMSEQLFPGLMDQVKPEDLKQMEGLFGGKGGENNPFANLFGGAAGAAGAAGKAGENPFANLFGGNAAGGENPLFGNFGKKPAGSAGSVGGAAAGAAAGARDPFNFDDLFADFLKPNAGQGKFNGVGGAAPSYQNRRKPGAYRQMSDSEEPSESDFEL